MTKEQEEAIGYVQKQIDYFEKQIEFIEAVDRTYYEAEYKLYKNRVKQFETVLNMLKEKDKEIELYKKKNTELSNQLLILYKEQDNNAARIEKKNAEIEKLKENINYQTLCDFLISSVSVDEEPVWTEKHIEELLENFEVRWKDAYKQNG